MENAQRFMSGSSSHRKRSRYALIAEAVTAPASFRFLPLNPVGGSPVLKAVLQRLTVHALQWAIPVVQVVGTAEKKGRGRGAIDMGIPNILTIFRILLIPAFIMTYSYDKFTLAAVLFILASLTDLLDGFLARAMGQVTKLGALLDPLADKLLLLSSFALLFYRGIVPLWVLIIVLSKDVVVVSGWMIRYFLTRSASAPPSFLWKVATFAQITAITTILTGNLVASIKSLSNSFLIVATILTALSMLDYLYRGLGELEKRTTSS